MKPKIVLPILTSKGAPAVSDTGGAASIGGRTRRALSEQVEGLTIEPDSLDQVIQAAVKILDQAVINASNPKIQVDTLAIHVGITAGGRLGILGTGVDVEAEASFEITFRVVGT